MRHIVTTAYLFLLKCIFTAVIVMFTPVNVLGQDILENENVQTHIFNAPVGLRLNDDEPVSYNSEGWQLGAGIGFYVPGSESANYYNGGGKNSLRRVLFDYPYNYDRLKEAFNHDFYLDSANLPTAMKYTPAVMLQFASLYNFNENNGVLIEVGYAKLYTSDFFTLIIDDPANTTSDPTVELGTIWGVEERVSFNMGYFRSFGKASKVKPFFEVGVNLTDTKLKDNKAQVLSYTYTLVDPYDSYYGYKQGGLGFGYYTNAGAVFNLGESFAAHLGGSFSLKRINLLPDPGYSKEWVFFVRLLYKNLFGSNA